MGESAFDLAVSTVLIHEGGFVDDPDDPGGATNFGISLRFLEAEGELDFDHDGFMDGDINFDGVIDVRDIQAMNREDAIKFYRTRWWDRYGYEELSPMIGPKVFDLAVNMGARQAHLCLQRACRACRYPVTEDGIIGQQTMAASIGPVPPVLLAALRSEAAGFYRQLVASKPKFDKYLDGWLKRAYA